MELEVPECSKTINSVAVQTDDEPLILKKSKKYFFKSEMII